MEKIYKKIIILLTMVLFATASVIAAGEITQDANRLNYWVATNITITVVNTGTLTTTAAINSTWTVVAATAGCSNIVNAVTCDLASGATGTYTVTSDGSVGEYATQSFTLSTNNSYTSETVTFVRIQDTEIFRTLVEYGRGRGDYFFDSSTNRKGIQCTDLPANTNIELNYLHKLYPIINTYLNLPAAEGSNVSLYCIYPNETASKSHLVTNIVITGGQLKANYTSDWLTNSWERVFFLVQDFDATGQPVGSSITISCSDIKYYLPAANGWVNVNLDSFTLNYRNSTPLTITAASNPSTIGTGTSEVIITYNITNTENMILSSSSYPVSMDIKAPTGAKFIGTRAEMWGSALDIYHYEINSLGAGESILLTLVAEYTTTGAGASDLSAGASVSFIPCWQINSYNPQSVDQNFGSIGTITISGAAASTMNLQTEITNINNNLSLIQTKLDALTAVSSQINSTVNNINSVVLVINTTTMGIDNFLRVDIENKLDYINGTANSILALSNNSYNYLINDVTTFLQNINATTEATYSVVTAIQTTVNEINTTVNGFASTLSQINTTVNTNNEILLQINGTVTNINQYLQTTIYNYLNQINLTTQDTQVTVNTINSTVASMQVTVNNINSSVTDISATVNLINGTVNNINVVTNQINSTTTTILQNTNDILNVVNYINNTRWGNLTAQDIYNLLANVNTTVSGLDITTLTNDMSSLSTDIRQLREFNEESIYLITDSITEGQESYKQALTALDNGDKELALKKLQESVEKLSAAEDMIAKVKADSTLTDTEKTSWIESIWNWVFAIFR